MADEIASERSDRHHFEYVFRRLIDRSPYMANMHRVKSRQEIVKTCRKIITFNITM